ESKQLILCFLSTDASIIKAIAQSLQLIKLIVADDGKVRASEEKVEHLDGSFFSLVELIGRGVDFMTKRILQRFAVALTCLLDCCGGLFCPALNFLQAISEPARTFAGFRACVGEHHQRGNNGATDEHADRTSCSTQ